MQKRVTNPDYYTCASAALDIRLYRVEVRAWHALAKACRVAELLCMGRLCTCSAAAAAAKSNDKKEVKVLAKQTVADPGLAQGAHPTYMNT